MKIFQRKRERYIKIKNHNSKAKNIKHKGEIVN